MEREIEAPAERDFQAGSSELSSEDAHHCLEHPGPQPWAITVSQCPSVLDSGRTQRLTSLYVKLCGSVRTVTSTVRSSRYA